MANEKDSAPEPKVDEEEMQAQDAKILRIPPWEWRQVKRERTIKSELPALIVSSKGHGRAGRQLTGRRSTRHHPHSGSDPSKQGEGPSFDTAYLLAINSRILLSLLADCTGTDFPEDRNVWLRPFKYLVAYETEIRRALQEAEGFCHELEAGSGPSEEGEANSNDNHVRIPHLKLVQEEGEVNVDAAKTTPGMSAVDASRAKVERDHLGCLVDFMDTDMQDILDVKRQVANQTLKEVAFEHLWLLYSPGDLVYSTESQEDSSTYQAYRVLHVTGGRPILDVDNYSDFDPVDSRLWDESEADEKICDTIRASPSNMTPFIIDCFSIDSDGNKIGPKSLRFVISNYSGNRKVDALEVCPSFFHPQPEKLYQALVERGRRFTQLAHGSHKRYSGLTLRESRELWRVQMVRLGFVNYVIHEEQVYGPSNAHIPSAPYPSLLIRDRVGSQ